MTDTLAEPVPAAIGTPVHAPTAAKPGMATPAPAMSPRTKLLLEGPILRTLLRLAGPNVAVMVIQGGIGALESYYVAGLGTNALAGVSLVFPVVMAMQMMSAGAMGGGVSSAIARALGGGRKADAQALVWHAIWIAVVFGALFTGIALGIGPWMYAAMGGRGDALSAALTYSAIVFLGSIPLWMFNTLANVLRGTGNMVIPAVVTLSTAFIPIALSPAMIYGWGPIPRLGVAGAGFAIVLYYTAGVVWLAAYLASGRAVLSLAWRGVSLKWARFWEILRVGLTASLGSFLTNFTIILVTGFVGAFGTAAIAGYGIGARLEYMQIPLIFGFGAALVAMVGTNIGAGQFERAHRIAWIGASLAGSVTLTIGGLAALFPLGWAGLFSSDPAVLEAATGYLHIVGPGYGFLGFGLALYFASQGAGRMGWPLAAGTIRMGVAVIGAWLVVHQFGAGLHGIFMALLVAMLLFAPIIAAAIRAGDWRRGRVLRPAVQPPVQSAAGPQATPSRT
jgi:putative MATE family efflux protein